MWVASPAPTPVLSDYARYRVRGGRSSPAWVRS
jgi:hypothetical protein